MRSAHDPARRTAVPAPDQRVVVHQSQPAVHVGAAIGGSEAIGLAAGVRGNSCDVGILDINMPDVDGLQVAAAIREREVARRSIVVLHSALDKPQVRARISDYDEYVRQPADMDRLAERIKACWTCVPKDKARRKAGSV